MTPVETAIGVFSKKAMCVAANLTLDVPSADFPLDRNDCETFLSVDTSWECKTATVTSFVMKLTPAVSAATGKSPLIKELASLITHC